MRFGFFDQLPCAPGFTEHQRYHDIIAQIELGNDRQAIDALLQAVSLAPPTPQLHAALASAYALTGRRSESREQIRLMQEAADPAALQQLLQTAALDDGRPKSRYLQGLDLAFRDAF